MPGEQENYLYCIDTLKIKDGIEHAFMTLAERFYRIRQERFYEPYWSSWMEYCFEFKNLAPSSISKLTNIYAKFIVEYGYKKEELNEKGFGWTVLASLLPVLKSKKHAVEVFDSIEGLSRQDIQKTLTEGKTGISMAKCKHKDTYTVRICRDCGERWQEHEEV